MPDEKLTADACIRRIVYEMTGRESPFATQGGASLALGRYVAQHLDAQTVRLEESNRLADNRFNRIAELEQQLAESKAEHEREVVELRADRDEWRTQHENLLAMYQEQVATVDELRQACKQGMFEIARMAKHRQEHIVTDLQGFIRATDPPRNGTEYVATTRAQLRDLCLRVRDETCNELDCTPYLPGELGIPWVDE